MTHRDKIKFSVEKTGTGFSAFAEDYPVYTTGSTLTALQKNCAEALNLYLKDRNQRVTNKEVQLQIDLQQFFSYYRVINARFLAQRIGMNATLLSQYVRGNKTPSPQQIHKILKGIREVGEELTEIAIVPRSMKREIRSE
jgi:transcriptional regulator with XRE-family HTH domain